MCGVLGLFYEKDPVALDLLEGLLSLQHRGQNSAGILTSDLTLHLKKGNGLVSQVFNEKNLSRLTGSLGIGHTRYPTIGPGWSEDAQPFYVNYPYGTAMAHNGNVTNYFHLREELKKKDRRQLTSFCDLEPILHIFAGELEKTKRTLVKPDDVFRAIKAVFHRAQGAYSVVGLIHRQGLFAFRDAKGIRPLVIAQEGRNFAVASESVALDILGFKHFCDINPGEAIFIDHQHRLHRQQIKKGESNTCIFEFVYFARPDSVIDGTEVYEARLRLGEKLAEEVRRRGLQSDIIIAVPDTARPAGVALARILGLELREGLIKNRYIARTFIMPSQSNRAHSVRQKLNPVRSQIQGKNVLIVDDSIVRGTTSREIVQMIRGAGARRVFLAITAPPLRYPCVYGIDMMTRGEFIAKGRTEEEIRQIIGADALIYQTYQGLIEAVRGEKSSRHFCTACFKGTYPTGITRKDLRLLEAERTHWMQTVVENA
ncbi:MAG: amidophosphoribosyltransferase [bacterium]